jgi:tungstate transport system permease protein
MTEAFALLVSGDSETWGIVGRSLHFAFSSTFFALVPGIPAGVALGTRDFRGRRTLVAIVNALMALPTVVVGLCIYTLISRSGPLGFLGLLYSGGGVILGQACLAFPIVASVTQTGLSKLDPRFRETIVTLGAGPWRRLFSTLYEARTVLIAGVVSAFGRVTGEVGVAMMLGGNIRFVTRTMTTAIALDSSKGDFDRAVSLGLVLLVIALGINVALHALSPHEN